MRNFLQGFRTIIFNITAAIAPWFGVEFDAEIVSENKTAVTITIITLANILLRIITKTPVGKNDKGKKLNQKYGKMSNQNSNKVNNEYR